MNIDEARKIIETCKSLWDHDEENEHQHYLHYHCGQCEYHINLVCSQLIRTKRDDGCFFNSFPLEFESPEEFIKFRMRSKLDRV